MRAIPARRRVSWVVLAALVSGSALLDMPSSACSAEPAIEPQVLTKALHHLRIAGPREWSDFPEQPEASDLELRFTAKENGAEAALVLRQQDVKQTWRVLLNGEKLGSLIADENDMVIALSVPVGRLKDGENILRIEQVPGSKDSLDGAFLFAAQNLIDVEDETEVRDIRGFKTGLWSPHSNRS